jgi:rod shape-determining protein MreD
MPCFLLFDRFYDLLAPFVIYLGLFRSTRESIPIIIVFGFIMDNLSGGPLGLYLTTYLWLFAGVKWVITILQVRDNVLLPFVVAVGVLLENIIFMGTITMFESGSRFSQADLGTVAVQVVWALVTGPIFLILFNRLHQRWDQYFKEMFSPSTS